MIGYAHKQLVDYGDPVQTLLQELLRDEETLLAIKLDMPFVYKFEKELAKMGINSHADKIDQLVEDIWALK